PWVVEGRWGTRQDYEESPSAREGLDRLVRSFADCSNYIAQAPQFRERLPRKKIEPGLAETAELLGGLAPGG
ncbi:MAG: hypothetical protein KDA61_17475, partial [Planctomycetales bacterium]|nr:hypothetical protein [Planctomycetales bacterium]